MNACGLVHSNRFTVPVQVVGLAQTLVRSMPTLPIGPGAPILLPPKAGLLKYNSWEFTVKLFQDEYRVPLLDPAVAARIAMTQELTIPIFLFLGLATRIATLPLLGMIAVIQTFVYPNAYNDHLVWGSILVLLLARGPGVFSVDFLIERRFMPHSRDGA